MVISLPAGFVLRHPGMEDAEAVLQVIAAQQIADEGVATFTLDDVLAIWQWPEFSLAADGWVVTTAGGQVVGYADVRHIQHAHIYAFARVHPAYRGRGIG